MGFSDYQSQYLKDSESGKRLPRSEVFTDFLNRKVVENQGEWVSILTVAIPTAMCSSTTPAYSAVE